MTPAIYTTGQLRAYVQGRLSVVEAWIDSRGPLTAICTVELASKQAQAAAYREVIAMCRDVEAHDDAMTVGKTAHSMLLHGVPVADALHRMGFTGDPP